MAMEKVITDFPFSKLITLASFPRFPLVNTFASMIFTFFKLKIKFMSPEIGSIII